MQRSSLNHQHGLRPTGSGKNKKRNKAIQREGARVAEQFIAAEAEQIPENGTESKTAPRTINGDINGDTVESNSDPLVTRSAADYTMEEIHWMWNQKIPKGKIVLFTGKPDCGKSLCALDIAARVSTGKDFPDGSKNEYPPGKVLIAASEDEPADTIVPRLAAVGADLHNIRIIEGIRGQKDKRRRILNLKHDIEILTKVLQANQDTQLFILDPVTSFMGKVRHNQEEEVRPVMDELKQTCAKSELAVIGILHHNKRSDVMDAIDKVSHSGAYTAAARAVWQFSKDREDKNLFHMAHVKGNLTKDKSGLDYRIEDATITIQGKPVGIPRIEWGDKFEGDASDLLAASREQRGASAPMSTTAKEFLRNVKYPIKAKELYAQAEDDGLSVDSVKNAKHKLEREGFYISVKKQVDGWWWYHEKQPISN
jgi:putative DNA primase/helicase